MRNKYRILRATLLTTSFVYFSCQKDVVRPRQQDVEVSATASSSQAEMPPFNLEVILRGQAGAFGLVKFRQDIDPSKIITLDTWVRGLEPNHGYFLQRAVDPINVVDGNCTSTSWLTLGKGLTLQSITTDGRGAGTEELWRDVTAIPTGSTFDIHFRIVDATSMTTVLTSDCYQYTVR